MVPNHCFPFICTLFCYFLTVKPRPGSCPSQLNPPAGPCASDSDECMFDWDCEGTTKKCCTNNCFKECVEPSLSAAIRGKSGENIFLNVPVLTPWPQATWFIYFRLAPDVHSFVSNFEAEYELNDSTFW